MYLCGPKVIFATDTCYDDFITTQANTQYGESIMTSSGLKAIYERPGGEYAELGLNLYAGCSHNCVYCYNKRDDRPQGRYDQPTKKASLQNIQSDLMIRQGARDKTPVHISFVGDPYDIGRRDEGRSSGLLNFLELIAVAIATRAELLRHSDPMTIRL